MEKYEMFDKIIKYHMRELSTPQISKYLDEYTNFIKNSYNIVNENEVNKLKKRISELESELANIYMQD